MIDDDLVEGTEELVVSLTVVSGPVQITTQSTTITILDNDCEYISTQECPL